jgi:HK97 family phage prohead protease
MSRILQRRTILSPVNLRDEPDKPKMIFGYAAMFNEPSQDLGGFVEILEPGCFAKSIDGGDQRCFFNHDYNKLLGRTKSGTLRLWEDDLGLAYEDDIDDTTVGLDTYRMTKRKDLDGNSFGFYSMRDEWNKDGTVNRVLEAELIEVSPVVFPAYLQTQLQARSIIAGEFAQDRLARRPSTKFPRLERAKRIIRLGDEA